jgi:hypothetical protein
VLVCTGDQDLMARGGDELAAKLGHGHHFSIEGRNHMNAVPARAFKDAAVAFLADAADAPALPHPQRPESV